MKVIRVGSITLAFAILAGIAAAAPPSGAEFRISTSEVSQPRAPSLAFGDAGHLVVVWENERLGIVGRIFDPALDSVGPELVLVPNVNLPSVPGEGRVTSRREPAVVVVPGGFFLFWTEETAFVRVDFFIESRKVLERDILGQRFDLSGAAAGPAFLVSRAARGFQSNAAAARSELPTLGPLAAGRVLVAWQSNDRDLTTDGGDGAFAQLYDDAGTAIGDAFRISHREHGVQVANVALAGDGDGSFLLVWQGPDGSSQGIFARLLRGPGALGPAFALNTAKAGMQRTPAVAFAGGRYLAVWQGEFRAGHARTYGRFVDDDGDTIGGVFRVGRTKSTHEQLPAVAPVAEGFRVAWMHWDGRHAGTLYARTLELDGDGLGPEAGIATWRPFSSYGPAMGRSPRGDTVVVWIGFFERRLGVSGLVLAEP